MKILKQCLPILTKDRIFLSGETQEIKENKGREILLLFFLLISISGGEINMKGE